MCVCPPYDPQREGVHSVFQLNLSYKAGVTSSQNKTKSTDFLLQF